MTRKVLFLLWVSGNIEGPRKRSYPRLQRYFYDVLAKSSKQG